MVVALGGDGFMLQTLRSLMRTGKPVYGMHRGTIGFLMNEFNEADLDRAAGGGRADRDPSAGDARHRSGAASRTSITRSTRSPLSARATRPRGCAS